MPADVSRADEIRTDIVEKAEVAAINTPVQGNPAVDANQATRTERTGRRSRGGRNRNKNRDVNREEGREPRDPNAVAPAFVPNDVVVDSTPIVVEVAAPSIKTEVVKTEVANTTQVAKEAAVKAPKAAPKPKAEKPVVAPIELVESSSKTADEPAEKVVKAKAEKKPAARKPAKAAKPIDLAASGLQLVETKGDMKVATPTEPAKPKGPRKAPNWKKDAESKSDDAPLVMVETQK